MSGADSAAACATPIPFDQLVDYWTNELETAAIDAIDEHVFGCAPCAGELERVQRVVGAIRGGLPPVISNEQLAGLRAQGLTIVENTFEPGTRREITFAAATDLMIHRLAGLALADATRVSVTVRSESGGLVHEEPFAPFDPATGEVLIACQRHFSLFAADVVFDVRVHAPSRPLPQLATYVIPHVFVSRP